MQTIIPAEIDHKQLKENIFIKGANSNNLKNLDLVIPKNKLVVVTGLSGSGKSSLIMDTLYAEGQRRYVESLSSYARQFLSRMKKPEVEYIKGICPAIAIEQRVSSSNARSSVGSLTEINDYLRLLYARIGTTISPVSGKEVKRHTVSDVIDYIFSLKEGTKIMLFTPLANEYNRLLSQELDLLVQKGYTRIKKDNEIIYIEDFVAIDDALLQEHVNDLKEEILLLVDRFVVSDEEENKKRVADSVLTAFQESHGDCYLDIAGRKKLVKFNNRFELDGITFIEPTHQLFNNNNPFGACPQCEGYGKVLGIDPDKVIPDDRKSVYDEAVACWTGEKTGKWRTRFITEAGNHDFPIHRPIKDLTKAELDLLWEGKGRLKGILSYFDELREKTYKIQNRVMLARFRGKTKCPTCGGGRLRPEALYVKVGDKSISELMDIPLDELYTFISKLKLSAHQNAIAERILYELKNRLQVMNDIGLSYLHLDRESSTLSGGETQRINLTRILGSNLTNSLYILDEPSIGLHPKDTENLVHVLKRLRDLKNSVIVVEHEEEVIRAADYIIDIGPKAGIYGGELVHAGEIKKFVKESDGLTAQYLKGEKNLEVPSLRRKPINKINVLNARQHNLQNVSVTIPLNAMTVLSGVSGSGKTTLVKHILYPGLNKAIGSPISKAPGKYDDITGDLSAIKQVEMINQSPLGRSSRSNPITYVKAYDGIRKLFSKQQLSKIRGYQPKHFSFNVEGGRCETCKGDGDQIVEMQFLSDVRLVCEDCNGHRFKSDVLDVKYKDKNIYDVLEMSIDEAMDFFQDQKDIINKISPLYDVGLGYTKLGQSSSTLSGGEAQRVKLASYLNKESKSKGIFFIFDEPTTGLHFHDVVKLMEALNGLVENGHTVLIIEHNMDVIKSADWLIDLGPGGGKHGGKLLYQGPPEGILKVKESHTAKYLKDKLS